MTASSQDSALEPPPTESNLKPITDEEADVDPTPAGRSNIRPNSGEFSALLHRDVQIDRATPLDQKALHALELRCFDPRMAFHSRQIKDLLRNPRADIWIMRYSSQIIAQVIVLRRKFRDGVHARIYSLTVDHTYRGLGLSRTLVLHVLDDLRAKLIRNVYLEVESDAIIPITLYHALGFVQHHVLTDYYDIGRHGIKMRKTL